MNYFDPHDNSFCAKNLREEEWREYQRNEKTLELAASIKEVFDRGLVAKVSLLSLERITKEIAGRAGTSAVLIQDMSGHWACLALAMLTHGRFEYEEGSMDTVIFSKSPYEQEPMYYNNIEYVPLYGRSWFEPVRKKNETKTTGTSGNGQNDSLDGIFRGGIKERDSPEQGRLFDFHEGS
jgi:hypothetical protein